MAQTYNMPMASSATLSASRVTINDAHAAHQSAFAGTSAPSPAVAGQFYFNSSDNGVYWTTNGTTFYKIFTVSGTYGDILPRSGGSGYAMSGDLYMGSNKVKSLANPSDSGDAATKGWAESTFLPLAGGSMSGIITCGASLPTATANPTSDNQLARKLYVDGFLKRDGTNEPTANLDIGGYRLTDVATPSATTDGVNKSYVDGKLDPSTGHDHDGTNSKKVIYYNLDTTGVTGSTLLEADGSAGITNRHLNSSGTVGTETIGTSWADVASVSTHTWSGETRYIFFGFEIIGTATSNTYWRLRRDTTDLISSATVSGSDVPEVVYYVYKDAGATSDATYEYHIEMYRETGGATQARLPFILVI